MSFWNLLGDVGAIVAAPFTGGASLAAIPAINSIGSGGGGGPMSEQWPGTLGRAGGSSTSMPGGMGNFGGLGGYGAGMGFNTLGQFLQARAGNQVRMQPLPPPNALFPGL